MPIFYMELPGNMPDSRTVELIMKELEHAGFRNLILITDRGYESMKNLEFYISKRQKVITSVKVGQGDVLKEIKKTDLSSGIPDYKQYDCDYAVKGNGDNTIKADRLKINLYFSPVGRANAINALQTQIEEQLTAASAIKAEGTAISDEAALQRQLNLLTLVIDEKTNTLKNFCVNTEKRDTQLKTSGFFASKTIGLDLNPSEAVRPSPKQRLRKFRYFFKKNLSRHRYSFIKGFYCCFR